MASDLAFVQHVCDQLRGAGEVSYKKMFGEYAIYLGAKTVALRQPAVRQANRRWTGTSSQRSRGGSLSRSKAAPLA